MKRILYIKSSLSGENSVSTRLANELVNAIVESQPGSVVTTLDLAHDPLPHLDAAEFGAWTVDEGNQTDAERHLTVRSDRFIDQLQSHDTLVLAVPMYNLGIPSTLKAWIDRVARAGKTFRYTAEGPQGMVKGVNAYLIFARGGIYENTPLDTQTGHLTGILGMMGITDLEMVYAEGLNMGEETRTRSITQARQTILQIVDGINLEVNYAAA